MLNLLNVANDSKKKQQNDATKTNYDTANEINYNTEVLKSNLCDYNDV